MKLNIKSKIFKTKNIVIVFFLILILPLLFFIPIKFVKAATYTVIDVHTAHSMINNKTQYPDLLILDVREQHEYDESHLHNATLIPLGQIDSRISELMPYNDTEIIVYCRTGVRGAVASQNLAGNHNFTKVFNMDGAITAWIAAGYPVWTSNNTQPSISFSFTPFILIIFGTITVLLLYYKKKKFI
ncbi:MAG: rhodanese-like domain-containing protein [Promethearchaeota archaeon]